MLEKVPAVESFKNSTAYDCDKVYYVSLKKGAVASDHSHEEQEIVYLMKGKAELTIESEVQEIIAPTKITIPPNKYHKFIALTDLIGLELKS